MKIPTLIIITLALAACGKTSPELTASLTDLQAGIVNGRAVADNAIEKQSVVVVVQRVSFLKNEICTGTLISEHIVMTAAHCVMKPTDDKKGPTVQADTNTIDVRFGNSPLESFFNVVAASEVLVHPDYAPNTGDPDIALIRFAGQRPQGTYVARLPAPQDFSKLNNSQNWIMIGYGQTKGVPNQKTNDSGTLRMGHPYHVSMIDDQHFMIDQNERGGTGICFGDSGGPGLVRGDDGKWVVMGVAGNVLDLFPNVKKAQPKDPDYCHYYGIYTAVFPYEAWIRKFIASSP